MKILIGLGNPGKEYEQTRHNAGFMLIDLIAKTHNLSFKEDKKFEALISETFKIGPETVILVKPITFMNLSGRTAQKLMQFYKISSTDLIIAFDDIDLPLGKIRIRENGNAGTHNGMKSLIENIGNNFPRLRLGIESRGLTSPEEQEIASFVIGKFAKSELPELVNMLIKGEKAFEMIITEGIPAAMNKFN